MAEAVMETIKRDNQKNTANTVTRGKQLHLARETHTEEMAMNACTAL